MAYSFNVTAALQEYIAGRRVDQPFTKRLAAEAIWTRFARRGARMTKRFKTYVGTLCIEEQRVGSIRKVGVGSRNDTIYAIARAPAKISPQSSLSSVSTQALVAELNRRFG